MAPRRDSDAARDARAGVGELFAEWSKRENDMMFGFPSSPDGHLLNSLLTYVPVHNGRTILEELKARGYDTTTLRFSVMRRWPSNGRPADEPHAAPDASKLRDAIGYHEREAAHLRAELARVTADAARPRSAKPVIVADLGSTGADVAGNRLPPSR